MPTSIGAFSVSGDPNIDAYGEAVLIRQEGDLPGSVMDMLAAQTEAG